MTPILAALKVIFFGELYFHDVLVFFAQLLIFQILLIFVSKYVKRSKHVFLLLEIFTNNSERLRILIRVSNYFQTLKIMEKSPPIRMSLYIDRMFGIDVGYAIQAV